METLAGYVYAYDFAKHFAMELRAKHRSLLFRISVAEHRIFASLLFFTSALGSGSVAFSYVSKSAMPIAEKFVLPFMPADVHAFVRVSKYFPSYEISDSIVKRLPDLPSQPWSAL